MTPDEHRHVRLVLGPLDGLVVRLTASTLDSFTLPIPPLGGAYRRDQGLGCIPTYELPVWRWQLEPRP